ncbi:MAG: PEP-CTERM sorting domain-containing protein [Syntrophales bacterium]
MWWYFWVSSCFLREWHVQYTVYEDSNGVFHWTSPSSGNQFTGHSVPEPATLLLLSLGLVGLAGVRRKFQN